MTAATDAAGVVATYEQRAQFARTETAAVRQPRLLRGLLESATHVAEIPCGAGHFLSDYARAEVTVTLVDASAAMLSVSVERAAKAGISTNRTFPTLAYLNDLRLPGGIDLVIAPNGALNQLACQSPLTDLLAALRKTMRNGTEVLAQVACIHPGGAVDAATFYDATCHSGVWLADRRFDATQAAGAAHRYRRQHRDGDCLRIDFDYQDATGKSLHTATVELTLFTARRLTEAFTAAGFAHVRFLPGQDGLSEVLATVDSAEVWS
ncbi:MAG: class I SAM-dependent methyltransferase [Pseudonocardia sp.]